MALYDGDDESDQRPWRIRAWRWVEEHDWHIIIVLAVIAFGLGLLGYREYARANEVRLTASDIVYLSVQLFIIEGSPEGAKNLYLEVARFPALFVAIYALVRALIVVFADEMNSFQAQTTAQSRHHLRPWAKRISAGPPVSQRRGIGRHHR